MDNEYDSVLDALYKGLVDGYGGVDAINEVLDVVALKRGYDSHFEAALKERVRVADKGKADLEEKYLAATRLARNDTTKGFHELIEKFVYKPEMERQEKETYATI